jgi:hypothetical protein
MNDSKFLGLCILIAALIIGGSLVYQSHVRAEPPLVGRYQFMKSDAPAVMWIMDTTTGEVKTNQDRPSSHT